MNENKSIGTVSPTIKLSADEVIQIAKNNVRIKEIIAENNNLQFNALLACDPQFEIAVKIDPLFDPAKDSFPKPCAESEKNWVVYANWNNKLTETPTGIGIIVNAQTGEVMKVIENTE